MFDTQAWGFRPAADFGDRQAHLIRAAAEASESRRARGPARTGAVLSCPRHVRRSQGRARCRAGRANARCAEAATARGAAGDRQYPARPARPGAERSRQSHIGNQHDAPLWRALAHARQGKWAEAREGFKNVETTLGTLPIELQRLALKDSVRAAIEVSDFDGAADQLNDFETLGLPRELEPTISVLTGRLAEGLGRTQDALTAYRAAADACDRPAAAQGQLRETVLRSALGDLKQREVDRRAGNPDRALARRRDRDRGAASAGAALYRGAPLSRRLLCHAHRPCRASEFGDDAPHPGRGGRHLRRLVPGRAGATRCRRSMRSACSTISASSPRSDGAATK